MSNFTPEPDPHIRRLARKAAKEIKALTNAHNSQIESIYRQFRQKAAAIRKQNQCLTQPTTEAPDVNPDDGTINRDNLESR